MDISNFKKEKGVAGLTIFLSVITMLFVIGLLIMIFALMGGELEETTDKTTDSSDCIQCANTTIYTNVSANAFVNSTILAYDDVVCTVYNFTNHTTGTIITSGNYTLNGVGGCYITMTDLAVADSTLNATSWNVTYRFVYDYDTTASGVIGNATTAIGSTVEWFDIFIVITAMIVLILLTVIIITTIRGSGLLAGGGETPKGKGGKPKNIGSA